MSNISFIISMGDNIFGDVLTFLCSFGGAEWLPIPERLDCWGKLEFFFLLQVIFSLVYVLISRNMQHVVRTFSIVNFFL